MKSAKKMKRNKKYYRKYTQQTIVLLNKIEKHLSLLSNSLKTIENHVEKTLILLLNGMFINILVSMYLILNKVYIN